MTKSILLSNCCNAPVKPCWGDDFAHESKLKEPPRGVTVWNVCTACQKVCDAHTENDTKDFGGGWAEVKEFITEISIGVSKNPDGSIHSLGLNEDCADPNHLGDLLGQAISKARKEAFKEAAKFVSEWHIKKGGYTELAHELKSLK